jgi:Flp pilus assembly protein TadG
MFTERRSLWRQDRGGALVELAVALPLLVVILAGTVDFARVFYASVSLTNAARAGAQWGASKTSRSDQFATIESTAEAATSLPGVTASATRLCMCATDSGTFSATSPTPNDCSATCSGGHIVMTVTVTANSRFTTIMNILPGVPSTIDLSRAATLRVVN